MLGFPGKADFTAVEGSYSNENNDQGYFEATAPFSPGMSGGPVYNKNGVVIGIIQGGFQYSESTKYVIPLRWARSWLQDRTSAVSTCGGKPVDTSVPAEGELCSRVKQVIKAADTKFRSLLQSRFVEGGFNSPKVRLPSTKWCALNQRFNFISTEKRELY